MPITLIVWVGWGGQIEPSNEQNREKVQSSHRFDFFLIILVYKCNEKVYKKNHNEIVQFLINLGQHFFYIY